MLSLCEGQFQFWCALISLVFSMSCQVTLLSWCKWQSQFLSPDFLSFQYVCLGVHVTMTAFLRMLSLYTVSNLKSRALIPLVFNMSVYVFMS
jgi:hypothetical protein